VEINIFKFLTYKRFINILLVFFSYVFSTILKKPMVWGKPITFSIEPTNRCNLKCPECPSGLGELTRNLGLLSIDNFKLIINQIKDTCFYIQLFFQGEPYINKHLSEMIAYARNNKVYTSISTNGLLLSETKINEILNNPPDKLIFSIDGLDEESYQKYRVGGKFADAEKALKTLITKRNDKKQKLPFVELQFIAMKQNENQISDVFEFGNKLGVNKVVIKTMQLSSYENALEFMPLNKKYSRYFIENNQLKIKSKLKNECFALWRTSVITWDGDVAVCCFDKDASFKLGNVFKTNFNQIWKNENYSKFRQRILSNRRSVPMCTNCTEGLRINIFEE